MPHLPHVGLATALLMAFTPFVAPAAAWDTEAPAASQDLRESAAALDIGATAARDIRTTAAARDIRATAVTRGIRTTAVARDIPGSAVARNFAPPAADTGRAFAIAREVERIAVERTFWPGFDPLSVPLAIYSGGRTYLFRHPSPPEGFAPLPGAEPAVSVFEGRHPAMIANTSMEIGGVVTATLLADDGATEPLGPRELAAVALHEAFHVFQRQRHPRWRANEANLMTYPTDDAGLLALRRRESAALRRALAASHGGDDATAACWTRLALEARRDRFAAMDSVFPAYERGTEMNEGLAAYIELRAAGRTTVELPEAEFPPAAVRVRAYTIGPALAFLLDRFRPGWQAALEEDDARTLDELLGAALDEVLGAQVDKLLRAGLDTGPGKAGRCGLDAVEAAEIERVAREDVAALIARRTERRKAFDAREGWRVIVEPASGRPLWPQGFDPINLEHVDGGLLHTRFLRLANDSGELEAIDGAGADIEVLTEPAGPHPLFAGIARAAFAGFAERPEVSDEGGRIIIRAPGFTASFRDADVEERGRVLVVRLR